jgi:hypothetical protein
VAIRDVIVWIHIAENRPGVGDNFCPIVKVVRGVLAASRRFVGSQLLGVVVFVLFDEQFWRELQQQEQRQERQQSMGPIVGDGQTK